MARRTARDTIGHAADHADRDGGIASHKLFKLGFVEEAAPSGTIGT